jgi:hypothetical protein
MAAGFEFSTAGAQYPGSEYQRQRARGRGSKAGKKTPRRIGQGELSGLLLHRKPAQGIGNTLDHPARAGCDLLHNSLDWLSRTALSHYLYSFQGFEK